jgi:hypothetical protein
MWKVIFLSMDMLSCAGGEKSERQEKREEDERKKEATRSLLVFYCQISSQFVLKKLFNGLS